MFKGQVLTPSGWRTPVEGEVIAYMGGHQKVTWQKIEKIEKRECELVTVRSNCLSYAISQDHEIKVHKMSPLNALSTIKGYDILVANERKEHRLRLHHLTHAYPELSVCNPRSVIQDFALAHLDSERLNAIPEKSLSLFRRYLEYRLVYPQAYLLTQRNEQCYRMCHLAAISLVALLFPVMRGHDGLKKPKNNTLARCFETKAADLLQVACFFSGITSVIMGEMVKLYLYSKRSKLPFRPEITPASTVSLEYSEAFEIDVKHPLVKHEGRIVIL